MIGTPEQWQAVAEVAGVIALLANAILTLWLYRLRYMFVGHVEFRELREHVINMENRQASMVTRDDVQTLINRIGSMEQTFSKLGAQLEGNQNSVQRCNNLLDMLLQNELDGKRP